MKTRRGQVKIRMRMITSRRVPSPMYIVEAPCAAAVVAVGSGIPEPFVRNAWPDGHPPT
jgi:hypothetical protein